LTEQLTEQTCVW